MLRSISELEHLHHRQIVDCILAGYSAERTAVTLGFPLGRTRRQMTCLVQRFGHTTVEKFRAAFTGPHRSA